MINIQTKTIFKEDKTRRELTEDIASDGKDRKGHHMTSSTIVEEFFLIPSNILQN